MLSVTFIPKDNSGSVVMKKRLPDNIHPNSKEGRKYARYKYLIENSPLNDPLVNIVKPKKVSKKAFVLDGVSERTSRGSVVPSYNALTDKGANTYFQTPSVINMLKASATTTGQLIPASTQNIKLSRRNRIPDSPGIIEVVKRENKFVADAIKSCSMKTKTKPIIPAYDAMNDQHAANYFRKSSVKSLLRKTCDIKV